MIHSNTLVDTGSAWHTSADAAALDFEETPWLGTGKFKSFQFVNVAGERGTRLPIEYDTVVLVQQAEIGSGNAQPGKVLGADGKFVEAVLYETY